MRALARLWNAGLTGKLALLASGAALLACLCCGGVYALDSLIPPLPPTPTLFALPQQDRPTATAPPPEVATITPLPATLLPSATMALLPTFTDEPLPTAASLLPTATFLPTTAAPTELPPTAPPPTEIANPWPGCPDLSCGDFGSCAQVREYLSFCPQYWSDLDRDGDGVPCEDLCD